MGRRTVNELLWKLGLVMTGGALGSGFRFAVAVATQRFAGQPPALATWVVNLAGSLLFGVVLELTAHGGGNSDSWRLFWLTGMMGALTTFSTLMMDTARWMEAARPVWGLLNLLLQNGLGLLCIFVGLHLGRWFAGGSPS